MVVCIVTDKDRGLPPLEAEVLAAHLRTEYRVRLLQHPTNDTFFVQVLFPTDSAAFQAIYPLERTVTRFTLYPFKFRILQEPLPVHRGKLNLRRCPL